MPNTALITGAGGALGSATARAFADAGWQLALFAYDDAEAARLREAHPDALVTLVDLTNEASARSGVNEVHERFGDVDALLAIAGGFAMTAAHETSMDDLEKMLALNVKTLFTSVRAVLPGMLQAGHGFILGISAAAADAGGAHMAPYAASKAAVAAYLRAVRSEVQTKGIAVTTLYPMTALDTPANRDAMPDADPSAWIDRDELAATMLHAAERGLRGQVSELRVFAVTREEA